MNSAFFILMLSVLAPVLGSLVGVWKRPTDKFMYEMLSFAAGVMLGISFLELIPESIEFSSIWVCVIGIITGSVVMYGVDRLLPHIHPEVCSQESGGNLNKTAIYLIVGIGLHNLPEGMAIAVGSVAESKTGLIDRNP
jgi:ZIP family zinc transporter